MSVFGDFQRLWMQRFPHSSLSDAWESDVRASLERHKQKIIELKKELEQETLYVEYLERLLSDVEKCKEDGTDPTKLFEAATASQQHAGSGSTIGQQHFLESSLGNAVSATGTTGVINSPGTTGITSAIGGNDVLGHHDSNYGPSNNKHTAEENVTIRRQSSQTSPVKRDSNKYSSLNPLNGNNSSNAVSTTTSSSSSSTNNYKSDSVDDHREDKDAGTEKDFKNIQFQKNGALNQCITELASGLQSNDLNASSTANNVGTNRHSNGDIINNSNSNSNLNSNNNTNYNKNKNNHSNNNNHHTSKNNNNNNNNNNIGTNIDDNRSENNQPSHFVTVIEVKESKMPQTDETASGTPEKQSQQQTTSTSTSTTTIDLPIQENDTVTTTATITTSSSSLITTSTTLSPSSSKMTSDTKPPVSCNSVSPGSSISSGNNRVSSLDRERHSSESEVVLSSFERKSKYEPSAPPMPPSMSASTSAAITPSSTSSSSSISTNLDAKKKVPPRPPPKLIRRVEPPTIPAGNIPLSSSPKRDLSGYGNANGGCGGGGGGGGSSSNDSPSSSLERNIRPSDILRQKSSESLDAKNFIGNRKTTPEFGKFDKFSDLTEEFGQKAVKSDSLEKTKRTDGGVGNSSGLIAVNQSPTGSLGKSASSVGISPTGSLSKFSKARHGTDSPPTGSLEKMKSSIISGKQTTTESSLKSISSKESLASQGNISEMIKSYESISSLSSDSTKAGGGGGGGSGGGIGSGGNGNNNSGNHLENEPYYDTVPMDNGDGEYVYIKPGGTGSTSSRDDLSTAGSTLPMPPAHAANRSYMNSQTSVVEPESPGRCSNYANIDYFLHPSTETRSSSLDSDGELDAPLIMRTISQDETTSQTPGALRKVSGNLRGSKIRSILNSIIQSESIYVECLNKMIQYKKAIHSTLNTSQPVIREEEENTIFFKIEELHAAHVAFLNDLRSKVKHEGGDILVGDAFKRLADIIDLYSAFLHNYGQAIETVKKCSANSVQFKNTVSTIVLKLQNEQSLTLEDLLHKPVARVQINALVFNDLLNETPVNHPDHHTLRQAQKTIHVFLKQFNVVNQRLPTESNKNLRRMVKSSFIVELVDGHRKLRHLFLFNDVIACAKYKASGRDRFELELKWFIPLKDVYIAGEDSMTDTKESSPANILQLKSQACTVRDQILLEEKDDKKTKANGMRVGDKHRRKLADLEGQLVLASPNLVFKIGNKQTNKTISFFLSSDFERTQWIESILSLQQSCNIPGANTINALEIQAFVFAMQNRIKTEMGSYLMRNKNDESLLVGDLHITVQGLTGLDHPADLYICIEVDSYGHYFRKAKTKMVCRSTCPLWNESFVLELEGSQNVRILLYEAHDMPILRAKYVLKLSRSWLQEAPMNKQIKLNESILLTTTIRFVPGEVTLRRVPTSKPGALFGAKMSQVLKREKRDIPFIISACIREVERRGMAEVGIYRVSGSASDLAKLKKSFETNAYEAEQLLKEVDIHSVTGILKSYLRELPEALFTDLLYPKLFETFNQFSSISESARIKALMAVFEELPQANKSSVLYILDHLIRVHQQETENKMSLHNLAMVFGPTLLRPGQTQTKQKDLLASSTVDVMAQAGILYCFLQARIKKD